MPSKSTKQQNLFRLALAIKLGKAKRNTSKEAAKLADSMTEKQLKEFAEKVRKAIKTHKSKK